MGKSKKGYAAIIMVLIILTASLAIITGFTFLSLQGINNGRSFANSTQAKYAAEAGLEDALYRKISGKQIGTEENLAVGEGQANVTIVPDGNNFTISSQGNFSGTRQNLEITLTASTTASTTIYTLSGWKEK